MTTRAAVLKLVAQPKKKDRPYSAGYIVDGVAHAKKCDCNGCARVRVAEMKLRLKKPSFPEAPKYLDQTVFVRPHFRRQSNHYNRMPNSRHAVRELVRQMLGGD